MRVWVVIVGEYSDQGVAGVFSSLAEAERYVAACGGEDQAHVHDDAGMEIDEENGIVDRLGGRLCWHVQEGHRLGIKRWYAYPIPPVAESVSVPPATEPTFLAHATVWALNETDALALAKERCAAAKRGLG